MGIASRLACRLGRIADGLGPWGRVAIVVTVLGAGVVIGDHLPPASEPLVMAPLRWGTVAPAAGPGWAP